MKVNLLDGFYKELIKTQSLLHEWKKEGRAIVKAVDQMNIVGQQEESCVLKHKENEQNKEQISFFNAKRIDEDGNISKISFDEDEITQFFQEQIEREPIDIKPELSKHEDTESTHEYDQRQYIVQKNTNGKTKDVVRIPNKCYICDSILGSESDFSQHLESHNEMVPYECSQCTSATNPIILSTVVLLNEHFESHSFNFFCRQCHLQFRTRNKLYYHMRTAHDKQTSKYSCKICGKVLSNAHLLQSHLRGHKCISEQRYKCEICQRAFTTLYTLRRHGITHVRDNQTSKYSCEICGKALENARILRAHLRGHKYLDEQRYKCEICQKVFRSLFSLRRHRLLHTKQKETEVKSSCTTIESDCQDHME
ncbi:zinc finger protein 596-like isoform X2 [Toxorhynchites rutilus septentrionalis]|nr:zinc finger protein 596-like isoform X2 [Toxorhynchites rutilus septentrionalis]